MMAFWEQVITGGGWFALFVIAMTLIFVISTFRK